MSRQAELQELRAQLDAELEYDIDDGLWRVLRELGHLDEHRRGELTWNERINAAKQLEGFRRAGRPKRDKTASASRSRDPEARKSALQRCIAAWLCKFEHVKKFRQRHLPEWSASQPRRG